MVNFEWYRTFKAIYQNGTLTKAAEELMISQPNVSIQLASLETYIGHPLFMRLPRKMEPTEYGKRLYTQIVESIDNLERVESEFKKTILNKVPTIRLGTPAELFVSYIARNVGSLTSNLDVIYGLADELTQKLSVGELDCAIITKKISTTIVLTYEPLYTEQFMIVCNPAFDTDYFDELVELGKLTDIEHWLKNQQWCAYSGNLVLIRRFWRENFKKRPILKLRAVVPDNNALLELIGQSNILGVTSNLIGGRALAEGRVKVLWEGNTLSSNDLFLAYDRSKIEPKLVAEVHELLKLSMKDYIP